MSTLHQRCYGFGPFCVYTDQRILTRDSEPVRLPPKTFETLLLLIENRDRIVEKQELIRSLWPDTFVEDINLTVHISRLRKIFGEGPDDHQYIVTVPRRGYRFVAAVEEISNQEAEAEAQSSAETEIARDEPGATDEVGESAPATSSTISSPIIKPGRHARLLFVGMGLMLILFAAGYYLSRLKYHTEGADNPRSIAVLPFQFIGEEDDQYMASAIADALTRKLGSLPNLTVRQAGSVSNRSGEAGEPLATGKAFGVEAVIYGNVQRSATGLKVMAQLARVSDGKMLWAQSFDIKPADMLSLQDAIAEQTARTLLPALTADERNSLAKNGTRDPQAYEYYMRGLFFWNTRSKEGLRKATDYFQRATLEDSNFGLAYAALADSYALSGYYKYMPAAEAYPLAKAAGTRALEIDDTIALAHIALGMVKSNYEGDMNGQIQELRRAVESEPNFPTAHQRYGWALMLRGHMDQALVEMKRAVDLDPLSVANNIAFSQVLAFAGRYDDAIEYSSKALELGDGTGLAHYTLGLAYQEKGQFNDALKELKAAEGDDTTSTEALGTLGHAYTMAAKAAEAAKILEKLKAQSRYDQSVLFAAAMIYAGMGDKENALAALKKAVESGETPPYLLRFDPRVAALREDPRFDDIVEAVGRKRWNAAVAQGGKAKYGTTRALGKQTPAQPPPPLGPGCRLT